MGLDALELLIDAGGRRSGGVRRPGADEGGEGLLCSQPIWRFVLDVVQGHSRAGGSIAGL